MSHTALAYHMAASMPMLFCRMRMWRASQSILTSQPPPEQRAYLAPQEARAASSETPGTHFSGRPHPLRVLLL